ncbi:MAG: hypothetical protein M1820_008540 [Bogoriella megaspora]|nr:MAG: hypothetical protein M1820_008540 [Bogoriella megaspora]
MQQLHEHRAFSLPGPSFTDLSYRLGTRSLSVENLEIRRGRVGLRTLNDPSDPYLEIVFVHGLLGDSYLTWTSDNDPATFWPEWFVEEIHFSNTRIHTFGYQEPSSGGRAPISKLRDIGVSLCSALELNTYVKRDAHNPIVFIAHSLGGLVVKAATIHAKSHAALQDFGRRFHTILFLATPHQEAGDHLMLRNILRACNTSTSRLDQIDPEPNTSTVQNINTNFYSYSQDLRIWSFFEAGSDVVVEKRRATIGGYLLKASRSLYLRMLPLKLRVGVGQEREVRVNADHADIAKFRSSSDPTYSTIREVLLTLVRDVQEELLNPEKVESQMRILANYLDIPELEDEEYAKRQLRKIPGTCDWLPEKPNFIEWRDTTGHVLHKDVTSQIYWLSGDPGCGKSYLATNAINHLRDRHCDCSFFFLKHGDKSRQSIGGLLRSIAYQMARNSGSIRRSLLSMEREHTFTAETTDLRTIWKQIFAQRIFRTDLEKHQYWVIDAIDEGNGNHELLGLLQSLPKGYSIFVTSRKDPDLERELRRLDMRVATQHIEKEDTVNDIRMYLEYNKDDLPADDSKQMQEMIQKLLEKSKGSFLWTHLIVQELTNYWTEEAVDSVLNNVPDGMNQLYSRILRKILQSVNRDLAGSILRWVICATRPLTVFELRSALRLDTSRTLKKPAQAIESICGPLVSVNNDRVELVHDTVRDFLFNRYQQSGPESASRILFDKGSAHEKLATICMSLLCQTFRAMPRKKSLGSGNEVDDEAFLEYAGANFSEHTVKSASADETVDTDALIRTILEFFQGPVLFWIQRQAEERNLSALTRAGKNLKAFVTKRTDVLRPLSVDLQDVQEWANDLIHIPTAFGKDLQKDPTAIHSVIPSLCPPHSKIFREFRNPDLGLHVIGLSRGSWPDRISSATLGRNYANALACCEKLYAVSLRSSQIVLFYATTCQEARRMGTPEAMKRLEFAHVKDWLIASGRTMLCMYNYETGENLWTINTETEILSLTLNIDDSEIIAVTREKDVETFSSKKAERIERRRLQQSTTQGRSLTQVHVSDEAKLIALIHRNEELELYDLHTLQRPKRRIKYSANIETIAFNPALNMLAMASFDGELCTVDMFNMNKVQSTDADVSHMDVSMDGKTLVVGCKLGDIQIHDFETLAILYKIKYDDEEIMDLRFTSNSLRFLDIRNHVFNVWEPAALVRRKDDDDSTSQGSTSFSTAPSQLMEALIDVDKSPISALAEHHTGDYVFCGQENGTVTLYETSSGKPKQKLFEFGRTAVLFMNWNAKQNLLASADNSSTVKIHQVHSIQERTPAGSRTSWQAKQVLHQTLQQPIRQILLSPDAENLLVSTTTGEYVFRTRDGTRVFSHVCNPSPSTAERSQKWVVHPRKIHQFLEIQKAGGHVISWEKESAERPRIEAIKLFYHSQNSFQIQQTNAHLLRVSDLVWAIYDNNPHTGPFLWPYPSASLSEDVSKRVVEKFFTRLKDSKCHVENFLGIHRTKLVFLSSDRWVCSVRVDEAGLNDSVRYHFPLPHYWGNSIRDMIALVTCKGDIVIAAADGDLAIIKRGL